MNTLEARVPLHMTFDSIQSYLEHERTSGASDACMRQRKAFVIKLYDWLSEDKQITARNLQLWRCNLAQSGYSQATILNHVKGINRYLDYMGRSDLRFSRGRAKDLNGKEYGCLKPLENTGKKDRNDYIWRCRCKCGKEVFLPATRLLTGNTLSCGCLHAVMLKMPAATQELDITSTIQTAMWFIQ